jgi:predicted membrane-bound spermidine synthase
VVFISSACTLILELVAGRVLAPYVGVSLLTWTSIIGVVLAGISIGNYLGGRIADKKGSPTTLSIILLASSLTTVGVLATTAVVAGFGALSQLTLMTRIVGLTFLIFFVPTLLMGMVTPVVIKLTLANLRTTGNTVGTIYAFSTAGSIVGTFLTGFFLIELMGVRAIVISVGVVLLLLAVASSRLWRSAESPAGAEIAQETTP